MALFRRVSKIVGGERISIREQLTDEEEAIKIAEWAVADEAQLLEERQSKIDALIKNELDEAARAAMSGQIIAIENMNDTALDAAMDAAGLT